MFRSPSTRDHFGLTPLLAPTERPRSGSTTMAMRLAVACASLSLASALQLSSVNVQPVGANGMSAGAAVSLTSLVPSRGAIIFAVRRPG